MRRCDDAAVGKFLPDSGYAKMVDIAKNYT